MDDKAMNKNCLVCGALFERKKKYSDRQWENARFCSRQCRFVGQGKHVSNQEIISLYSSGKSSAEIAAMFNMSAKQILRRLKEGGCQIRCASQNKKLSGNKPATREKMKRSATGRSLAESAKEKLRSLTGPKNANWTGGKTITSQGYKTYTKSKANGSNRGKLEHRVVAESKLGRTLSSGEIVHHIDSDKLNNNPNNLMVLSQSEHVEIHAREKREINDNA